jgi:uncharacterized damage-inducible protein DinB
MKWLDRKWDFNEQKLLPEECAEMLGKTPDQIRQLVIDQEADFLKQTHHGKWSVHEHVGHLLTMESLWIARLDDFVLGKETLRPWNGTNADTDAALFNRQRLGKIIDDFSEVRINHLNFLQQFLPKATNYLSYHERLQQTMTLTNHLYFMVKHDLHHLSAIEKIIEK